MKNLIYICIVLIMASCSRSPVNSFIDDYNQKDHTAAVTIPGWLVRAGSKTAFSHADESDLQGFADIASQLGKVRFMVAKEGVVPQKAVKQLVRDAQDDKYENYVTVRDGGKLVNVMVKQDGDMVKNLLLLVNSDEEFVITHIDSNISMKDLEAASLSWNKERNKNKK